MKEGLENGVDHYADDEAFRKAMNKAQNDVSCIFFLSKVANTFAISVSLTTKILVVFNF